MPDNFNLPKPNIPNPYPPTTGGNAAPRATYGVTSDSSAMNRTASNKSYNSFQKVTQPAGLDPQSPGGAPPVLNEKGQVTSTSTISQTPKAQVYTQSQDLPVSKMQQLQQAAGQVGAPTGQKMTQGIGINAINPALSQGQTPATVKVGAQQAIRADSPLGDNQEQTADVSHPALGVNMPSAPGSNNGSANLSRSVSGPELAEKDGKKTKIKLGRKAKQTSASNQGPEFASAKKPILKYVLFGLVALGVIAAVVFGITRILGGKDSETDNTANQTPSNNTQTQTSNVTLNYWGLWEPDAVLTEVLADFKQETGITVNYKQQSQIEYRTNLQSTIAGGNGPDIFRFHATWVPMLKEELAPLPAKIMSVAQYEQAFYPIAAQQLQINGQLVGVPLMYDGLSLYYNKDVLKAANEAPPTTWSELRNLAVKLTVRSGGTIERGGLAIGNTENVEHFAEILGLLIYQNGGNPAQPMSSEVRDAIQFFADFTKQSPVFSTDLPSSTVAFARGEVAMMFAPSWRAHEIKNINPELDFGIAPVPQLSEERVGWASYWAEGVNAKSKHINEAWQLLKYLSSEEVLKKLYSEQSQIRSFGEIYPRASMANSLASSEYAAPFLTDAAHAKSWYLCAATHDNGINDKIIDYYKDALNAAAAGRLGDADLQTLSQGVSQTLRQYGMQ